jgi:hypothetical protein
MQNQKKVTLSEVVSQIRREKFARGEKFDEIDLHLLARKRHPHLKAPSKQS